MRGALWAVETEAPEETEEWGRRLGLLAAPGDFFALTGPIGSGKSVLARGILAGLGVREPAGSPTFTIVHQYEGRLPAYHVDVYRLGPGALREDLGWEAIFYGGGVAVVEWAEFVRPLWPEDHLEVRLERPAAGPPNRRRLVFLPGGERGRRLLEGLMARC